VPMDTILDVAPSSSAEERLPAVGKRRMLSATNSPELGAQLPHSNMLVVEEDLREASLTWEVPAALLRLLLPLRRARLALAERALRQLKRSTPPTEPVSRTPATGLEEGEVPPSPAAALGGVGKRWEDEVVAGDDDAVTPGVSWDPHIGESTALIPSTEMPSQCSWATMTGAMKCGNTTTGRWLSAFALLQRRIRAYTDRNELEQWLQHHVDQLNERISEMEDAAALAGLCRGVGPEGWTFKPSVSRKSKPLQFFPINLHVQEMRVRVVKGSEPLSSVAQLAEAPQHALYGSPMRSSTSIGVPIPQHTTGKLSGGATVHRGSPGPVHFAGAALGVLGRPAALPPAVRHGHFEPSSWASSGHGEPSASYPGSPAHLTPLSPSQVGPAHETIPEPLPPVEVAMEHAVVRWRPWGNLPSVPSALPVVTPRLTGLSLGSPMAAAETPLEEPSEVKPSDKIKRILHLVRASVRIRRAATTPFLGVGATTSGGDTPKLSTTEKERPSSDGIASFQEVIYDTVTVGAFAAHPLGMSKGLRSHMLSLLRAETALRDVVSSLPGPTSVSAREQQRVTDNVRAWKAARRGSMGLTFLLPTGSSDESALNHAAMAAAEARWRVDERADTVLCQAAAALATAFTRKLRLLQRHMRARDGARLLRQYASIGFLFAVESLLTSSGAEMSMLEDFELAVAMLRKFRIRLVPPMAERPPAEPVMVSRGRSRSASTECESFHPEVGVAPTDWNAGGGGTVRFAWEAGEGDNIVMEITVWPATEAEGGGLDDDDEAEEEEEEPSPASKWPSRLAQIIPKELQEGGLIGVVPVFFTQGVNEQQTLSHLQENFSFGLNRDGTSTQRRINRASLQVLSQYVRLWQDSYDKETTKVERAGRSLWGEATALSTTDPLAQTLKDLADAFDVEAQGRRLKVAAIHKALSQADSLINVTSPAKALGILTLASSVARSVHGGRVTCCKSAKDRTSMMVTLEQESLLTCVHGPLKGVTKRGVRDLMRRYGVRLSNAEKNTGKAKFAFHPLQIVFLPEPLQPPLGTAGNTKT
jgi:hypothetical protein